MSTPKAKKAGKAKAVPSHPPYASMIKKAISSLKESKGSSRQAILKYIMANYKLGTDATAVNNRLKIALRRSEKAGVIRHAKGGIGASGRFKLGEKKEKKPKAKKPRAKKAKKSASPKKATKPKKPRSPKKAKKPASKSRKKAAKPKKKTSPKKKPAKK